jgi:hypothetical protein
MGSLKVVSGLAKHINIVILKECTKFEDGIIKAIFGYISFTKNIKKYITKIILLKVRLLKARLLGAKD